MSYSGHILDDTIYIPSPLLTIYMLITQEPCTYYCISSSCTLILDILWAFWRWCRDTCWCCSLSFCCTPAHCHHLARGSANNLHYYNTVCVYSMLTCALSPSYFHSQVNSAPSNLRSTSSSPLVGCANIGLSGMPIAQGMIATDQQLRIIA